MGINLLNLGIKAQRRPQPFVFTITTPENDTEFVLPLHQVDGHTHNFIVDWGDESESTITSYDDEDRVHNYAIAGNYTVTITGECPGFSFDGEPSGDMLTTIVHWGDVKFRELRFAPCFNLISLPSSIKDRGKLSLVTTFEYLFYYCTSLTSIPEGLFDNNIIASSFERCFYFCTSLASIPSNLFDDNISATTFDNCFYNTAITSIPIGLFDNNTLVTNFKYCFRTCDNLTSIPNGLFDNNTLVTDFSYCFNGCSELTSIPTGLFDNNILVTTFKSGFTSCTSLVSIASGLFDNNTAITTFQDCFMSCSSLTAIPLGLFDNNMLVTKFNTCFNGCSNLTGDAPELWLRDPEPTGQACFRNCTNLDNYDDIPDNWKL